MRLDAASDGIFRKKVAVLAFHSTDGATYHKAFGDLHCPGSHYVIIGADDDVYGVSETAFRQTYELVAGRHHTYRKTTTVLARQMPEEFTVESPEGPLRGQPGDWLVQNMGSDEQYLIPQEEFEVSYEPA